MSLIGDLTDLVFRARRERREAEAARLARDAAQLAHKEAQRAQEAHKLQLMQERTRLGEALLANESDPSQRAKLETWLAQSRVETIAFINGTLEWPESRPVTGSLLLQLPPFQTEDPGDG